MQRAQEEAVAWYARLQAPDCRPEERAQFAQWLQADATHTDAYAAVERLVSDLDSLARRDTRLLTLAEQAMAMGEAAGPRAPDLRPGRRWQQLLPYAAAASIVLSVFLALGLRDGITDRAEVLAYESPAGAQRELALDDGTLTNLDIDSAVTVRMTAQARDINLIKGRAFFDVAHDAQWPFSVTAGSSRVTALGTRFQVQHENGLVVVTLEEGSVEIVREFEGNNFRDQLRPGEQLRFSEDSGQWSKTTVETDTATSWARGRHVFRNISLGAAVDEVNRYAATKVRLGDPALADLMVSGNFLIGDSRVILSAFAAALPVRVVDGGNELLLFAADYRAGQPDPNRVQ